MRWHCKGSRAATGPDTATNPHSAAGQGRRRRREAGRARGERWRPGGSGGRGGWRPAGRGSVGRGARTRGRKEGLRVAAALARTAANRAGRPGRPRAAAATRRRRGTEAAVRAFACAVAQPGPGGSHRRRQHGRRVLAAEARAAGSHHAGCSLPELHPERAARPAFEVLCTNAPLPAGSGVCHGAHGGRGVRVRPPPARPHHRGIDDPVFSELVEEGGVVLLLAPDHRRARVVTCRAGGGVCNAHIQRCQPSECGCRKHVRRPQ